MKLRAFSFFHLNLAYSAISVESRAEVIERCYWPLLRLARTRHLPFGIEASAWTLETIAEIDPAWLVELRDLVTNGPCEFIGCGYAQVIGPLVPADVNVANFRIGMQRYEALLGLRPKIALVNEQAYSAGLVPLYREAGYEALLMEWNNPARANPEWDTEWRYLPQYACGTGGVDIPLIWNKSVSFQKVQRYVHGEMELEEYLDYVLNHKGTTERAFPIYGNDVEVFDFRPGRYMTEAPLHASGEWQRIDAMYAALQVHPDLEMVAPSAVLDLMVQPGAGNRLHLETAAHPVPVKKQDKYNIVRWAVTGRDDLGINTQCWHIYEAMQSSAVTDDLDWTELCYLWSSDFRTHITENRWAEYLDRLERCVERWRKSPTTPAVLKPIQLPTPSRKHEIKVERVGRFLKIVGKRFDINLNCHRGLALESFVDHSVSDLSLCGTTPHGYYDDIRWVADYYSSHLLSESPGRAKVTDLVPVTPEVVRSERIAIVKVAINTPIGLIEKHWQIDEEQGKITLSYVIHRTDATHSSLRLGFLTLNPDVFKKNTLRYETNNGGRVLERFSLTQTDFDHGKPVSFLVSANTAVGVTEGRILIGDGVYNLHAYIDKSSCAAVGLVSYQNIGDSFLSRLAFSIDELDDTCKPNIKQVPTKFQLSFMATKYGQ